MRRRAAAHLKGNIWAWIGGLLLVGAAALALGWTTPAAFLFMLAGLLIIMADSHVDPVALLTEDALHPEEAEVPGPAAASAPAAKEGTLADRAVLALPAPLLDLLPAWSSLAA
jgi:hypothetical protein